MAFEISIPFVHPTTLSLGILAGVVAERWLPITWSRVTRWSAASVVAVITGALLAAATSLPLFGRIHLAAYAVLLLAGFAVAWWCIRPRAERLGIESWMLSRLFLAALIAGILGARARFVQERWEVLSARHGTDLWWVVLDLDRGGAVWYGGLFLAGLVVVVLARWWRLPVIRLGDAVAPGLLMGLAVGRLGCFLNGCCYGRPCDLPWAVAGPPPGHLPVHPTQLYESAAAFALGLVLWWWSRQERSAGLVGGLALVGYGVWRYINEHWRGDHDVLVIWPVIGQISSSQGVSVVVIAGGLILLGWAWWHRLRVSRPG